MKTKNEKAISALIAVTIAFSILVAFSATASATTIYVPEGGNQTIQQAVDNATGGDIIIVRDGTYNENVNVYVASLTIRSENGSANCVVNASDPNDAVFRVKTANYVNISGFTVTGGSRGIMLHWVDHCNISNNNVSGNYWGIGVFGEIGGSNYADYNTVKDNIISNNTEGIWMYKARYNTIINNTILNNTNNGIHMDTYSNSNTIKYNDVQGNNRGIEVGPSKWPCSDNVVNCNNIVGNSDYGVVNNLTNPKLNATQNWWGDVSGPTHLSNPLGTGDNVSDNVDFEPWSFTPDPCEPKTIGFWKNHEDSVDAVLDAYGPIYLGNDSTVYYYEVENFGNATAVFKNATNKNALNMLAAQLLAAELNVLHWEHLGIAYCDCIDAVIDDADTFLSSNGYTGPDGIAQVKGKNKRPANEIKDDLDEYNQGVCPCT